MSSVLLKPSAITNILSYAERGSERSRAKPQERLQHLAAGTAGAAAPQGAGYGAITDRAAGITPTPAAVCFNLKLFEFCFRQKGYSTVYVETLKSRKIIGIFKLNDMCIVQRLLHIHDLVCGQIYCRFSQQLGQFSLIYVPINLL